MQILVNEEPFDVQFEGEEYIGDIFSQLNSWFDQQNYTITKAVLDGESLDLSDSSKWKQHPLAQSQEMRVSVRSKIEMRREHLSTLIDFVTLFRQAAASGNSEVMAQLIQEYPPVRRTLDLLINPGDEKTPLSDRLDQLLEQTGVLSGQADPRVRNLIEFLQNLEVLLYDRLEEVQDPEEELDRVIQTLEQLIPVLEELPVLLQTGKDSEAMEHIVTFTELVGKLTRLLSYTERGTAPSLKETYTSLNPILSELTEAFENADAVLIGDLVEYELAPRISTLCEALRRKESR